MKYVVCVYFTKDLDVIYFVVAVACEAKYRGDCVVDCQIP